jgi:CelD/BcsL family acetyltransferase involved in cellulose biosynthesis
MDGTLRICLLRIGDRVAAMQLAVEQGGSFWLMRSTIDARYADCLPGLLLSQATIRYAAEAGLSSYEFLHAEDDAARVWRTDERACMSLRIYPLGIRGLAALAADCAAAAWERLTAER